MASKERWSDPANVGQPDYRRVGLRIFYLMLLLVISALVKIGIRDNWIGTFRNITGY